MSEAPERSRWDPVKRTMAGTESVRLGPMQASQMARTPRRMLNQMSHYKFATKMIGKPARVLDVGCGEGLGTWMLAQECGYARGLDPNAELIATAESNWSDECIDFVCNDFRALPVGSFDALVSFDSIEHVASENSDSFLARVKANLTEFGIAIVGTPNVTSMQRGSEEATAAPINPYAAEQLEEQMARHFTQVFMFGANDEIIHTGLAPMCQYLLALGCRKRTTPA